MADVGTTALLALAAATFVGTLAQGTTGLGFALLVGPVCGLVAPDLLPTVVLGLMVPLNAYVLWRERHAVEVGSLGVITAGRLAGTFGGLWLLVAVPLTGLKVLVGLATIAAVVVSLALPVFSPTRPALLAAGAVTGVTETATGIGGPPLAMVYQHRPAPTLRAMMAACFLVGELFSLGVLAVAGRVTGHQLLVTLVLLPAVAAGAALSHLTHRRVEGALLRTCVLGLALVSGVVLVVQA